ncbi:MAG TPA: carboxylating nicotinate-nucleotide diphosphorylase [Candidatus Kapabacteria bacterium]|nr:carboxylating nicotinate-nucleotide diphosphorylase [Candidatus Kapabacteria bacterium]
MIYKQINELPEKYIKSKIAEFIAEDIPNRDITTDLTIDNHQIVLAQLITQQDTVFIGEKIIPCFFDESVHVDILFKDGDYVQENTVVARFIGQATKILTMERSLLNLIQLLCGIANKTRKFVELAKPYGIEILDTRKTTPGLRLFEKYAVAKAGGTNHRLDLSSGILIKDNHLAGKQLDILLTHVKEHNSTHLPIEVEVDTFEQLYTVLDVGVDAILVDNMSAERVAKAVQVIRNHRNGKNIYIEASGGINLSNIEPYLHTGVNGISIGALTHSVKAVELHIEFV